MDDTIAKITRDFINTDPGDRTAVGVTWSKSSIEAAGYEYDNLETERVPHWFELRDDDGILYYKGWLYDDKGCITQQAVLKWAERDSGCTIIKIYREGRWVQDIG